MNKSKADLQWACDFALNSKNWSIGALEQWNGDRSDGHLIATLQLVASKCSEDGYSITPVSHDR